MGAVFEGLYRQDAYEIPPDAIRKFIINDAVHYLWKAFHNLRK